MARMLRWFLLLTLVLAVTTVVVSADGWLPSFGQKSNEDKAKDAAAESVDSAKSWTNWVTDRIPYYSSSAAKQTNEKLEGSKDTASNVAGESEEKARTTADTAREYAAKGLERMTSTKDQLQGATKGFIQRWGSWAKDNAAQYYSYGLLSQKQTDKATDKATDVVSNAASSVAGTTKPKEYADAVKEDILGETDEKEL